MHRPIRVLAAVVVAVAVSVAPSLAFGAEVDPPTGDTNVNDQHRDRVRLECEASRHDAGVGIGCKWSEASTKAAAGYRLWRAVDVPNPRDHRRIVARGGLEFVSNFDTNVSGGHTYHYAVEVVDGQGRTLGWSQTVRVSLVGDEQLRLACDAVDTDRHAGISCEWSQSEHPRFAGYVLIRSNGDERTTVFETREVAATRFLDEEVRRGVRYTYAVQVVDAHGNVIGAGGPSTAGLPPIADKTLRFDCALTSDGDQRGVGCKWSEATHPDARGYVLYRSVDHGAREELFRTGVDGTRRFFDTNIASGHLYTYAVVLLNGSGEAIGGGGPVRVAVPPTPTPKPVDPKTVDVKPVDVKPVDPKPVDAKPVDRKPEPPTDRPVEPTSDRPLATDSARPIPSR